MSLWTPRIRPSVRSRPRKPGWARDRRPQEPFGGPRTRPAAYLRQAPAWRALIRRRGGSVGGGWRGGRVASSSAVASAILRTARSIASEVRADGLVMPPTFRTYCRDAAEISSGVASGSRPLSIVMFRHMPARLLSRPHPPKVVSPEVVSPRWWPPEVASPYVGSQTGFAPSGSGTVKALSVNETSV
jgi:hypothetical protein